MNIAPAQADILTALRSFMLTVVPPGVDVVKGIENRVPEPAYPDFVVMTPIRTERLATNLTRKADVRFVGLIESQTCAFTGSIEPAPAAPGVMPSGILTVTAVESGSLPVGAQIGGVLANTFITGQTSGTAGGIGVYTVNIAQSVDSQALTATWGLMTVTEVTFGLIIVGATVFGVDVAANTLIGQVLTGTGGVGTYAVTVAQDISSEVLSSGALLKEQKARIVVQLDFHAEDGTSIDVLQTMATAFRDGYAADFFNALAYPQNKVSPLYADDGRLAPFTNENQQVEWRWVGEAHLQANQVIAIPQQFADALAVTLIDVSTSTYPP